MNLNDNSFAKFINVIFSYLLSLIMIVAASFMVSPLPETPIIAENPDTTITELTIEEFNQAFSLEHTVSDSKMVTSPADLESISVNESPETYSVQSGSDAEIVDAAVYSQWEYGQRGKLFFPSIDYNIPIKYDKIWRTQPIVDAENLAAVFEMNDILTIGDHNTQGFEIIRELEIGDICEITFNDITYVYELTKIDTNGLNAGTELLFSDNSAPTVTSSALNIYTCTGVGDHIVLTTWSAVSEHAI